MMFSGKELVKERTVGKSKGDALAPLSKEAGARRRQEIKERKAAQQTSGKWQVRSKPR